MSHVLVLQVRRQLTSHQIKLFDFGGRGSGGEEIHSDRLPLAVVSSNVLTKLEDGRTVRGREYPWGVVNIENKAGTASLHKYLFFIELFLGAL